MDDNNTFEHPAISVPAVGEYFGFGSYIQNGIDREPIEWLVLEKNEDTALLLCRYVLDCRKYNEADTGSAWENSDLRKWLNGEFLNNAFTPGEQAMIADTHPSEYGFPKRRLSALKPKTDKVFLLGLGGAKRYIKSTEAKRCIPTAYAKRVGAWALENYKVGSRSAVWWRMHSDAFIPGVINYVLSFGLTFSRPYAAEYYLDYDGVMVRPALRIKTGNR